MVKLENILIAIDEVTNLYDTFDNIEDGGRQCQNLIDNVTDYLENFNYSVAEQTEQQTEAEQKEPEVIEEIEVIEEWEEQEEPEQETTKDIYIKRLESYMHNGFELFINDIEGCNNYIKGCKLLINTISCLKDTDSNIENIEILRDATFRKELQDNFKQLFLPSLKLSGIVDYVRRKLNYIEDITKQKRAEEAEQAAIKANYKKVPCFYDGGEKAGYCYVADNDIGYTAILEKIPFAKDGKHNATGYALNYPYGEVIEYEDNIIIKLFIPLEN